MEYRAIELCNAPVPVWCSEKIMITEYRYMHEFRMERKNYTDHELRNVLRRSKDHREHVKHFAKQVVGNCKFHERNRRKGITTLVSDASEILHDVAPFRMLNRQRYEMLLERAYKFDFVATKVGSTWAPLDSGDERIANNLFYFLDTNETQEIDSKEFFGALMFFEADYSLPSEKGCNVSQTSNPFYLLQHLFVIYASSGKVVWSEDMDCSDVGTVTLEDLKGMWSCLARDQSTCAHLIRP